MRIRYIDKQKAIYFFIAIVIGLLNWYSTPTMLDDLSYRFVWQPDWDQPLERISSFDDVVRSQVIHYWVNSGRFLIHIVVQIFLNLLPPLMAKLLNTAMFLLMIWLMMIIIKPSKELQNVTLLLSFAMLFLLLEGFYTGFVWLVGALNYLWPIVITMLFFIMLRQTYKGDISWPYLLLLLPLSFAAGWTHEALSVPIAIALLYWLYRKKKIIVRTPAIYCVVAYILGTMAILLSPALWGRVDAEGMSLQQRMINGIMNMVLNVRVSWLLLFTLGIQAYRDKLMFKNSLRMNRYILLSWAAALGIVVTCGCTIERVAIFADFMAMLVLLRIWQGEWLCRYKKPIAAIAMFVSVCVTIPAMDLNRENYNNYLYHCEQLENPNSFIIKTRQVADSRNLIGKWLRKRYVNPNVQYGFYCCYMAFDCHDFNSRAVAHLFNKDSIIMLPEDIVDKIERDSMAYSQWEADRDGKLYVWKLDSSQQVNHVTFMLGDEVPLRFYQRLVAYNGYEYELDSFNYEVITIKGCNYLVMTIPTTNIKRRIKEIIASPSSCERFAAQ